MVQVRRENKKGSILDSNYDLISVFSCQFSYRWLDDARLVSWVMKVNGICAFLSTHIINTA